MLALQLALLELSLCNVLQLQARYSTRMLDYILWYTASEEKEQSKELRVRVTQKRGMRGNLNGPVC